MNISFLWITLFSFFLVRVASEHTKNNFKLKENNEVYSGQTGFQDSGQDSILLKNLHKTKTEYLADVFKKKIQRIKSFKETELVILVDASSSIGDANFKSEMKYIQKIVSDLNLDPEFVRLAVITYSTAVVTQVNHLQSEVTEDEKCSLLHYRLPGIKYAGGSTNTRNALIEAEKILMNARPSAQKVIFLVTDGFSNRGDPIPVADYLKQNFVTIYTFGIENGNVEELRRIASRPIQEHLYLFESFSEFEGFERRALHQDLKPGTYVPLTNSSLCDLLCEKPVEGGCCDKESKCSCGKFSGHFACLCPPGYYGTGLRNQGCTPCPNGTYSDGKTPGGDLVCIPCPDNHQITVVPAATSKADCACIEGYVPDGEKCKVISCPELSPPSNGYFVKKNCSNVLNAACGVRCHLGYTLSGSSVRICQKNGTWSGVPPSCFAKRCESLKPVPNSDLFCKNEEDNFEVVIKYNATGEKVKHFVKWLEPKSEDDENRKRPKLQEFDITTNKSIELNYTIDTECTFSCSPGYFLVGSKSRSCLPMLRWSGLKNTCKAIKCHPLPKLENGTVTPENCTTKGLKHNFAEVCSFSCNSGYELKGPNATNCTGRHGSWSGKNNPSKCLDVEPPKFTCPTNMTVPTDEGVHFATLTISLPNATDNSGKEPIIWSKPPIEKNYPLRFIIGTSEVQIYSVDDSGNYALCSFRVLVEDVESPKILECESPPVFFITEFPPNSTEIKWKEPVVDDNSGVPIPLTRNPSTSEFPLGTTPILYTAIDSSGNNASCSINITILENPCYERPEITNTIWNCSTTSDLTKCNVTCAEGFAFASNYSATGLTLNCTYSGRKANWSPDVFHGDIDLFQECSEIELPSEIVGEIIIDGADNICNDLDALSNEISNDLENVPVFITCEDEIAETEKQQEKEEEEEDTNVIRKKRSTKRRKKLRISFGGKGDKASTEKLSQDLGKTREKVKEFYTKHRVSDLYTANNESQLDLRAGKRYRCRDGFLLRDQICVKCPKGTFHNKINSTCDPCPIGEYQEVEGQMQCTPCPKGYSTRKIRRRNSKQCKKICPPGTFGRRKTKLGLALSPCNPCPTGHYQSLKGETFCEKCPEGFTTLKRGSTEADQCLKKEELEDLCFKFHCRNGGTCFVTEGFALCKCPPGFLGAFCERKFNPCGSSPCYNSGECVVTSAVDYECKCSPGFEGVNCEKEVNECLSNPCSSHGECIDLFDGFTCNCYLGFKGERCEERISQCEDLFPCLNQGTCVDVDVSYKCLCPEGYTGPHCEDFLECRPGGSQNCEEDVEITIPEIHDSCWDFSCGENMKCAIQWNRQPHCVCIEGYSGKNCSQQINPDVVLNFPKYGVSEYLSADFPQSDLPEISICAWIQTKDDFNYGTIFSYATLHDDNSFTLTDYSGLVLYASGNHVVTDLTANDGFWHFICVTWGSKNGEWKIYLDGGLHSSGVGLSNNSFIPGGGKLVIGQEQDFFGGGFNELESFSGRLSYFDVWDRVLQPSEIKQFYQNCNSIWGSFVQWSQLLQNIHGDIQEEESKFCKICNTNLTLFHGNIDYEYVGQFINAKYTCEEGFYLKFDNNTDTPASVTSWYRKCMKYGNWEKKEPTCSRVSCGFPGYFLSGKISGGSYLFGDILQYTCEEGYTLVGNATRICQADGTWSGETPSCRGNSNNCKKLIAPRHGSMFVYFNQGKPYGKTLPLIGDRVEFTCDKGYNLKGFSILTCLSGGIWDRELPSCEQIRCHFPKEASLFISRIIPQTATFYYGDLVTVSCPSGIKKPIMCGEFGSWNFSTATCGNKCLDKPNEPINGYIVLDGRNDSYYEGEVIYFKCQPGFVLLGDNSIRCFQNGTWGQYRPTICNPVNCGPPPRPPHPYFIAHEEGHLLGQRVFLDCSPGYHRSGDIITRCRTDGKWSRIQNSCAKNSCGQPNLPEGYTVLHPRSSYFYLDVIQIKCPSGKALVNNSKHYMTCQRNGLWSILPECY